MLLRRLHRAATAVTLTAMLSLLVLAHVSSASAAAPTGVSPAVDEVVTDPTPTFTWTKDTDPDVADYMAVAATSPRVDEEGGLVDWAFQSICFGTNVGGTALNCAPVFGLPTATYYWQVQSLNEGSDTVGLSVPIRFQASTGKVSVTTAKPKRWGSRSHPKGIRVPFTVGGTTPKLRVWVSIQAPGASSAEPPIFARTVVLANPTPGAVLSSGLKWRRPARLRGKTGSYTVNVSSYALLPMPDRPGEYDEIPGPSRQRRVKL